MIRPPAQLDGATVLQWVVSRRGCFYALQGAEPPVTVAGMAVCRYPEGGPFYLFKCDPQWEVVGDWDCQSVEEAVELASAHAGGELLEWRLAHCETNLQEPGGRGVDD